MFDLLLGRVDGFFGWGCVDLGLLFRDRAARAGEFVRFQRKCFAHAKYLEIIPQWLLRGHLEHPNKT